MTERGLPSPADTSPSEGKGKGKSKGKLTPFFLFSSEAREGVRLELTVGGNPPAGVNVAKVTPRSPKTADRSVSHAASSLGATRAAHGGAEVPGASGAYTDVIRAAGGGCAAAFFKP